MSKTVLIIDDSRSIIDMVETILTQAGYEVISSQDGQRGYQIALENSIDLAIVDIHMPSMDGLTLIKKLREHPNHEYTPLLVFTHESDPEKKHQGKKAGATGWLVKPLSPELILHSVRRVC